MDKVLVPALDLLLEYPELLEPDGSEPVEYEQIIFHRAYLYYLRQKSIYAHPNAERVLKRLEEIWEFLESANQARYFTLTNGVRVDAAVIRDVSKNVEETLPGFWPADAVEDLSWSAMSMKNLFIGTCDRDIAMLAERRGMQCVYFDRKGS